MITTIKEFEKARSVLEGVETAALPAGYSAEKLLRVTAEYPIVMVPVNQLAWSLQYNNPKEAGVNMADTTVPLVVTPWRGKLSVVHGAERLARAMRDGIVTIPCRQIEPNVLVQCQAAS